MITIESCRDFQSVAWKGLVEACGGNPLHFAEVHLADCGRKDSRYLVARRGADVAACAIGVIQSRSVAGLRFGKKTLCLPTAPASTEIGRHRKTDLYSALAEFGRKNGCASLVVQPGWGDDFTRIDSLARFAQPGIFEFVIDLGDGLEHVLSGMHKQHRKNIRRAEKSGLTVQYDASRQGVLRLRDLQLASARRAADRDNDYDIRSAEFFERLHRHVYSCELGNVVFARNGETCVAGFAWLSAAHKAMTVRSGCTDSGYTSNAMYFLQHEIIKTAIERGVRELNIGGVPEGARERGHPQHGLFEFKTGFGGQMYHRTGVQVPLN